MYGPTFMNERRDNLGNSTSGYEICWQQTSFFLYDRSATAIEWSIIKNLIRKNCNGIKGPFNLYPNAIFPIMYWWLYHAGCYLNFFFVKLCWANWTEIFISCTRLKQRNQRKSISTYLLNGNIFICFLSKEKTVGNMRCLIWIHMFQASFFL